MGEGVFGLRFDGRRYDCGSKAGFLQATAAFELARNELRDELATFWEEPTSRRNKTRKSEAPYV